ncbi:hypothetical protein WA158_005162 [Blastocystis sp. Blastoise]
MNQSISAAYKFLENQKYAKALKVLESPECKNSSDAHCLAAVCAIYDDDSQRCKQHLDALANLECTEKSSLMQALMASHYLNDYTTICKLYAKQFETNPKDIDIGKNYYLALLGAKDFKTMKAVGMKLYQIHKDQKYFLYDTGLCILEENQKSSMEMNFAEKIIQKIYNESKNKEERLWRNLQWLYIQICILNKHYETAEVELLERTSKYHVSKYLYDDWNQLLQLYTFMNKIPSFLCIYESHLLSLEPMDISWDLLTLYNNTIHTLYSGKDFYNTISIFINKYKNLFDAKNLKYSREYLLYVIENEWYLYTDIKEDNIITYEQCIYTYIDMYGKKGCCYEDIHKYIQVLTNNTDSISRLLSHVHKIMSSEICTEVGDIQLADIQLHVTCLRILLDYGHVSQEEIQKYYKIYLQASHDYSSSVADKEILSLDYLIIYVAKAIKLYSINLDEFEKQKYIYIYLTILEDAYQHRNHNIRLCLALISEYLSLSLSLKAYYYYHEMNITQVQLQSLSYIYYSLLLSPSLSLPHSELSRELGLHNTFFKETMIESQNKLIQSLDNYTYMSIPTIYTFRDTIRLSIDSYIPLIYKGLYIFIDSIQNDKKDALQTIYNNLKFIPTDLKYSHGDVTVFNFWNLSTNSFNDIYNKKYPLNIFILNKYKIKNEQIYIVFLNILTLSIPFFTLQKELLNLYASIYLSLPLPSFDSIRTVIRTIGSTLTNSSSDILFYIQMIENLLSFIEYIQSSDCIEESKVNSVISYYNEFFNKNMYTSNNLFNMNILTLYNILYSQFIYPLLLLIPKQKKGKKATPSIYDISVNSSIFSSISKSYNNSIYANIHELSILNQNMKKILKTKGF